MIRTKAFKQFYVLVMLSCIISLSACVSYIPMNQVEAYVKENKNEEFQRFSVPIKEAESKLKNHVIKATFLSKLGRQFSAQSSPTLISSNKYKYLFDFSNALSSTKALCVVQLKTAVGNETETGTSCGLNVDNSRPQVKDIAAQIQHSVISQMTKILEGDSNSSN